MRTASTAASVETPIFVDLDGTLVRTDLMFEAFLIKLKRNPLTLLYAVWWSARGGRALLKMKLSDGFDADPAHLPYDREVVAYLESERAAGRRVVLATAASRPIARRSPRTSDRSTALSRATATSTARALASSRRSRRKPKAAASNTSATPTPTYRSGKPPAWPESSTRPSGSRREPSAHPRTRIGSARAVRRCARCREPSAASVG